MIRDIDEDTRRQLKFFEIKGIPINDWDGKVSVIKEADRLCDEFPKMVVIEHEEIRSLNAGRLYGQNREEPRRGPYDIFYIRIPFETFWLKGIAIQEKYQYGIKVRLRIKIISDEQTLDIIDKIKYKERIERDPRLHYNWKSKPYRNKNSIRLMDMARTPEEMSWIQLSKDIGNLEERILSMETRMEENKKRIKEKEEQMSSLEKIIADVTEIDIPNGKINTEELSKKYQLGYRAIWYKIYKEKNNDYQRQIDKYNEVLETLGV